MFCTQGGRGCRFKLGRDLIVRSDFNARTSMSDMKCIISNREVGRMGETGGQFSWSVLSEASNSCVVWKKMLILMQRSTVPGLI